MIIPTTAVKAGFTVQETPKGQSIFKSCPEEGGKINSFKIQRV